MHNLYFVTIRKRCRAPFGFSDYLAIDLDGEPLRFQAELFNQVADKHAVRQFGLFSIDYYYQFFTPLDVRGCGSCSANQVLKLAPAMQRLGFNDDGSRPGGERRQVQVE